jgi:uncharacterized protein
MLDRNAFYYITFNSFRQDVYCSFEKICENIYDRDEKSICQKNAKSKLNFTFSCIFAVLSTENTTKKRAEKQAFSKTKTTKFAKVLTKANVCDTI